MPLTQVSPGLLDSQANAQGFRNRLINPGMVIDQRNAGASVTPVNGAYTLDRWFYNSSQASKFTVQQNAGAVTPPIGFKNYLGCTVASSVSVGASDFFALAQNIEGLNVFDFAWGTASAVTATLSFRVYSSLTGTFGGAIQNSGSTRSYPFTFSVVSANTWTTVSVTIPGDTSGTWLTTNGTGVAVYFGLGVGSTYSGTAGAWAGTNYLSATGATNVLGTNGATFYLTGVQLEVGTQATAFERRDYGRELILCQRYYQTSYAPGVIPGSNVGADSPSNVQVSWGSPNTSSVAGCEVQFPVAMRATPTLTTYDQTGASGVFTGLAISAGQTNGQTFNQTQVSAYKVRFRSFSQGFYGLTVGYVVSAEL